MNPATYDGFVVYKGATFEQVLYCKDPCGNAIDLTGYSASMQAKFSLDDADPFLDLTTENGGIVLGADAGTVSITMAADDTAAIDGASTDCPYNVLLTSGSGIASYILQGTLTVQDMA